MKPIEQCTFKHTKPPAVLEDYPIKPDINTPDDCGLGIQSHPGIDRLCISYI